MEIKSYLIGPFTQLLSMDKLPVKGALRDAQLEIIQHAGIWVEDGVIRQVGDFKRLRDAVPADLEIVYINYNAVLLPGYIDCHTHIAFGGSRPNDFALRNSGSSYLDIAAAAGGIWSTVSHTRALTEDELAAITVKHSLKLVQQGVTTIEVKSGYGLTVAEELKILRAIKKANAGTSADLMATCLAAHMCPKDFNGSPEEYLADIAALLFPQLIEQQLTHRIDAFIEKSAFTAEQIRPYLRKAQALGFDITIHADQFTAGSSIVAVDFNARSADHLEASTDREIHCLANSDTVAVALPAASLGLGDRFTPARRLLDAGAALAIASDWNPGSAPMGQLMTSAAILAAQQKLSNAEVLAALTFRPACALGLNDRGRIVRGMKADFMLYATDNYQDITYLQGALQPQEVWKNGVQVFTKNKIL